MLKGFDKYYNIPKACLLNRSPVPAMDLKSNRSGLWRHIIGSCRRLRRSCRKHSNNVARHDKTPVKSTFLSHDKNILSCDMINLQLSQHFCRTTKMFCHATWVWCRVGVTLCCDFYTFRSCNTCTFSLPTFALLRHTTQFFGVVRYIIKHLFYETAWSILSWNHANDVTSQVKVHREYSPEAHILHTKSDQACDVIFMVSK